MAKKRSEKELQKLGQMVVDMQELGYVGKGRTLGFAFLKGIAAGLGVFLGGTVLIALLLWILSFFSDLSFIEQLSNILERPTTGNN